VISASGFSPAPELGQLHRFLEDLVRNAEAENDAMGADECLRQSSSRRRTDEDDWKESSGRDPRVKQLSGRELAGIIERRGWNLHRVHGSHHIYSKPSTLVAS
jgi:hypothetical protein